MAKAKSHARLLSFPDNQSPLSGRIDAIRTEANGRRTDLVLDYHEFRATTRPLLFERDGLPWEEVPGVYQPRRLRFSNINITEGADLCAHLDELPVDHPDRMLSDAMTWRSQDGKYFYLFGPRGKVAFLVFTAQRCRSEEREGPIRTITLTRNWSPSPRSQVRLVPDPRHLHQRYGGNPIAIHLNGRLHRRRLFIGGLYCQNEQRPDVHTVLNLSEKASLWMATTPAQAADRWATKGEGAQGMGVGEIVEEARWVIERLQAGQRVLVHCSAGMNRSATVCCAVLILLEGLSAEAALERVREIHAWALPDSHYWLALRWLAAS